MSIILSISLILFPVLTSGSDKFYTNECQKDWFNFKNEKCLKVLKKSKMNFTEAFNNCQSMNSSLVTIDSEEENLFLTSILYDLDNDVKGLYIGLNRKKQNDSYINEFEWSDGSDLSYQNWSPGEPSPWFEPCVEMYSVDINAGKWNDLSCNGKRYALCQQLLNNTNEYRIGFELCEHLDYVRYRNNCYKAYDHYSALDWTSADLKCKSDHKNGSLIYIEDSYEHSFIKYWTKTQLKTFEFWIGLKAQNNSHNIRYEWVSEWPLYYTAWDSGQPKYQRSAGTQCVVQERETGLWRSDPYCLDKRAFVCKISDHNVSGDQTYASAICPVIINGSTGVVTEDWINLHKNLKHCHWFSEKLAKNWSDASKYCRKRNGFLSSIHSRHELGLLKPFVQKYGRPLWIGLYQSPGGFYRWEDGSDLDFQNWFPGEPTDEKKELCVEMRAQDMTWNDINCAGRELQFICETKKIQTIETKIDNKIVYITIDKQKESVTQINRNKEIGIKQQKGWLNVYLWIAVVMAVILAVLSVVLYFFSGKVSEFFRSSLNCWTVLNRGSYNASSVANSQRSSVNERNVFDISNVH